MPIPETPLELLTEIEYPGAGDPQNVLTAAVKVAFDAAADHEPVIPYWQVITDITDRLPDDDTLNDESRNYQRGLAAGIALTLLASADTG